MTDKVISVQETTPVSDIADLLERHRIKRVSVLYDGEHWRNFVTWTKETIDDEVRSLLGGY